MCGIWAMLLNRDENMTSLYDSFMKISKRGPDRSSFIELKAPINVKLGFHRLSIMDLIDGDQPFKHIRNNRMLYTMCNGEIYNHKELIKKYNLQPHSRSDCEILPLLLEKIGISEMMNELIGEYAFIILDIDGDTGDYTAYVGRDRFGIRPLFWNNDIKSGFSFCSEMKGLPVLSRVEQVKPASYMIFQKTNNLVKLCTYVTYYNLKQIKTTCYNLPLIKNNIKNLLIESVRCRLTTDRPLGCLLSGGLDSSLIASIAARLLKEKNQVLNTFSVGMPGSTDEYYAKLVSKHIGSNHTHFELGHENWLAMLPIIVQTIESYDITTVRASTGNYIVPKCIADSTNIKVLLIGDGSDELTSGYMYFHKAPSALDSHNENIRLLEDISYYDVLRADRGIANNGIEARVPFLDHRFVDYYLSIDPVLRMPHNNLEKWLLRESFADDDYLPEEVRLRKKEAFSDGVSSKENSWFQIIQKYVEEHITDEEFENAKQNYICNTPTSKEALYYRQIFESYYPNAENTIPYFWLPKWCGDIKEPSARILTVYND